MPWAEAKGRFTLLMERLIIDVLRERATVSSTCRLMRISWDEVWNVMEQPSGEDRKEESHIHALSSRNAVCRRWNSAAAAFPSQA